MENRRMILLYGSVALLTLSVTECARTGSVLGPSFDNRWGAKIEPGPGKSKSDFSADDSHCYVYVLQDLRSAINYYHKPHPYTDSYLQGMYEACMTQAGNLTPSVVAESYSNDIVPTQNELVRDQTIPVAESKRRAIASGLWTNDRAWWFLVAAKQGDPESQFEFAKITAARGIFDGTSLDGRYLKGRYNLALFNEAPMGFPGGVYWAEKSANGGYAPAMVLLAELYGADVQHAARTTAELFAAGSSPGSFIVSPDPSKAEYWMRKAASMPGRYPGTNFSLAKNWVQTLDNLRNKERKEADERARTARAEADERARVEAARAADRQKKLDSLTPTERDFLIK